jgi:ArsR family transcriptional regulator, arsenate/arsenite/antimonite-responsive transcriptional repressor
LSVLNEENRLRIICVLSNTQGYTVSQIVEGVELPQNLVSHHLKALFDLGIVTKNKSGLNVFYTLNQDKINEYSTSLMTLLNHKITL